MSHGFLKNEIKVLGDEDGREVFHHEIKLLNRLSRANERRQTWNQSGRQVLLKNPDMLKLWKM